MTRKVLFGVIAFVYSFFVFGFLHELLCIVGDICYINIAESNLIDITKFGIVLPSILISCYISYLATKPVIYLTEDNKVSKIIHVAMLSLLIIGVMITCVRECRIVYYEEVFRPGVYLTFKISAAVSSIAALVTSIVCLYDEWES
jgi:hypothetical protein